MNYAIDGCVILGLLAIAAGLWMLLPIGYWLVAVGSISIIIGLTMELTHGG